MTGVNPFVALGPNWQPLTQGANSALPALSGFSPTNASLYPLSGNALSGLNSAQAAWTANLPNLGISQSFLMLQAQVNTMMSSVLTGLPELLAGIMSNPQNFIQTAMNGLMGGTNSAAGAAPISNQKPNAAGFILPLDKKYIKKPGTGGNFGAARPGRKHQGNDFAAPAGTPIYAVKGGTIRIKPNNGGAGNSVTIDHGNGLVTKYFHLSRFGEFKDGQRIEQGQVLGYVGTTGNSSGNHLHFEVHQNGVAQDPWKFLSNLA